MLSVQHQRLWRIQAPSRWDGHPLVEIKNRHG
jgi:hypothetical protein